MRAMLCREYGPPSQLALAEIPTPEPGPGQVRVRVQACGVNFPDTLVIQGKYQFQPPMPFAPGTDIAGVVDALGDGVAGPEVGTPVVAFAGSGMGGFAEYALCDAQLLMPLPTGVSPVDAAAFFMTYSTSYHALVDRAHVQPGESVLVLGAAGGVGMAAVELAHRLGARVIAAAGSDAKLAACRESGADETINYATEDLRERLKALTNSAGVDVVYDPVGGDYTEPALRGIAWNGRYLVVGFANNAIPRIPLNLPLLKGCSIVGVFWGGFVMREPQANAANLRQLLAWLADGSLHPRISHTYPLAEASRALDDMLARRLIGKAVIVMEK